MKRIKKGGGEGNLRESRTSLRISVPIEITFLGAETES